MPPSKASPSQNLFSSNDNDDRLTTTLLNLNMLYQTHIHPLLPEPLQPISSNISNLLLMSAPYLSQMISVVQTVVSSASSLGTGQQDGTTFWSLGALLVTLFMGFKIMNYMRRTIMGWVWLGVKLMVVLFIVQLGWYVNQYGWERAANNAGWIGGIAWDFAEQFLNQDARGQQKQTGGTKSRGKNTRNYNDYGYGQRAGGRGRYG